MGYNKVGPEQVPQMKSLREGGWSYKKIANEMGISISCVSRWVGQGRDRAAKKRIYYMGHREEIRAIHAGYRNKRKLRVLEHYGGGKVACIKCGEARIACLSIDHINGGGSKHKESIRTDARAKGISGSAFYGWLIAQNFPGGYQTLCMNCQFIKRMENHEVRKWIL